METVAKSLSLIERIGESKTLKEVLALIAESPYVYSMLRVSAPTVWGILDVLVIEG